MAQVNGFEVIHDSPAVRCLREVPARLPLQDVVQGRFVSSDGQLLTVVGQGDVFGISFGGGWDRFGRDERLIQSERHALRNHGSVSYFKGLIVVEDAAKFPTWARQHLVPESGTAAGRWSRPARGGRRPGEGFASPDADRLQELAGQVEMGTSSFPGLCAACSVQDELVAVGTADGPRLVCRSNETIEISRQRRLKVDGGRMPIVLRMRVLPSGELSWYDGRAWGVGRDLDDLPGRLREVLDARGTARVPTDEPMRPLHDLRPVFILRVPTLREIEEAGGPATTPPTVAGAPAWMFDSTAPLRLLDRGGDLLDLPTITEPALAAAILVRCSAGTTYVPGNPPLHHRDLPRRRGWLVGTTLESPAR